MNYDPDNFRRPNLRPLYELTMNDATAPAGGLGAVAAQISSKLAADQDALIRRNITRRIGDDWTDADVIPRLRWEAYRDRPEQTLLLDDSSILVIWPATCETTNEDGRSMMNWKFNFREIP